MITFYVGDRCRQHVLNFILIFFVFVFDFTANFSDANKFIGNQTKLTWSDARAYCRTYHTDLASSFNSSETSMLAQLTAIQGDSWIGLFRDTWKWSDGTNVSYLPWASGKPNNAEGILGSCASVYNGLLSDEHSTNLHYFFCHSSECFLS